MIWPSCRFFFGQSSSIQESSKKDFALGGINEIALWILHQNLINNKGWRWGEKINDGDKCSGKNVQRGLCSGQLRMRIDTCSLTSLVIYKRPAVSIATTICCYRVCGLGLFDKLSLGGVFSNCAQLNGNCPQRRLIYVSDFTPVNVIMVLLPNRIYYLLSAFNFFIRLGRAHLFLSVQSFVRRDSSFLCDEKIVFQQLTRTSSKHSQQTFSFTQIWLCRLEI